jgi:ABC-2 type transport system ATP-binding protein
MPESIISVRNLQKTYTAHKKAPGLKNSIKSLFRREKIFVPAVKGVSFEIAPGELVGFLGPNGAGKTTTLKMLSGILYPTSGEATVLGHTPWKREKAYQKQFSLVMGQKNQLWWDLPAMDSFLLNKVIYEVDDAQFDATVGQLAGLLDIKDVLDIQVRKLSLGQRMKCELIAALLHKPKVLFLDEPTIGLDVVSQQVIREFIREYNREFNTTILLTSHYMQDVEALCKRVIIIDHGSIMYDGSLADLVKNYTTSKILTVTFTKDVKPEDFEGLGTVRDFGPNRVVLEVPKTEHQKVASTILTTFPVDDILIDEVEIEEVIRHMFNSHNAGFTRDGVKSA